GHKIGLEVHGGHGLDYRNVGPIVAIPEIAELSIGFSIVARAAVVGIERAVLDMLALLGTGRERTLGSDHQKRDGAARRSASGKYLR
ncbi:MAG: pyridoxine 5'-phosphate synthase, partial [Candidatus Aminicenantales bacterium]